MPAWLISIVVELLKWLAEKEIFPWFKKTTAQQEKVSTDQKSTDAAVKTYDDKLKNAKTDQEAADAAKDFGNS